MTRKPRLSFWEIWNMSFGFLGIQFGFALQNANVSRIFETLGASKDELPILWLAAPVTGLLVQPIIGYYSDRTWTRLGRRRPYFLVGAILASIALVIMPNSPTLWVAAGMLWIMDASINVSMEPFRAFVGDRLPDEQRTAGFAMQSFFIGTGAVVASLLPYIFTNLLGVPNTAPANEIPPSVRWSFYVGAAAFLGAVLWTVFKADEYPPEDMEAFREEQRRGGVFTGLVESFTGIFTMPRAMAGLALVQFFTWFALFAMWIYTTSGVTSHVYDMTVTSAELGELQKALDEPGVDLQARTSIGEELSAIAEKYAGEEKAVIDINTAKYFTDAGIGAAISPELENRLNFIQREYNDGADWVGVLFAVYNGIAALFAFALPKIARRVGRKATHAVCLTAGGVGLAAIYLVPDPQWLIVPMIGVGIAWASILSMPYAILAGALPPERMGYFMGVFNIFIVLPQIVAAGILGYVLREWFDGESIFALVFGGATMVMAAIMVLFVEDRSEVRSSLSSHAG